MTTFTTEDREHAFGATINVEPIPFVGWVNTAPPHIIDSGASVMDKPVAYIDRQDLERLPHHDCWVNGQEHKNSVPLYTHPVKTLTNEEILCLWDWWSGEILATDILDFADTYKRALLGEEGLVEWHQEYVKRMNNERK